MIENSIWRQYNSENNFRQMIARWSKMEVENLIGDDKALYGILKSKLYYPNLSRQLFQKSNSLNTCYPMLHFH
ncbi:MAG: hypothetical protein L3J10_10350 [Sulfurimonas sp.]|nr:hypothetical protein [Sulfurimonas sp.]